MSVKLKNINGMDYAMLLSRINTAICQFNNSSDQTEQAQQFIAKVDEISTSRSTFFDNIEKRLSKLLDPNKTLINWFISKRGTLEVVLSKIKVRTEADPDYLKKYSNEFSEGLELTEKLLALGDEDLSSLHIGDILKIKKSILELRSTASVEGSSSVKITTTTDPAVSSSNVNPSVAPASRVAPPVQPAKPAFAEDYFYLFLHEVHNILTLHFREDVNASIKLDVELYGWYNTLKTWNDKFKEDLTTSERIKSGYPKRIKTVLSQLTQLAAAAKQSRVNEAITSGEDTGAMDLDESPAGAPSPSRTYLVLPDLMTHEWKRLQRPSPPLVNSTTLSNKRRKINDDNSGKLKLSSRLLNKLDTSCDDEELRIRQIVESWPGGSVHGTYNSLLQTNGAQHYSGTLSFAE